MNECGTCPSCGTKVKFLTLNLNNVDITSKCELTGDGELNLFNVIDWTPGRFTEEEFLCPECDELIGTSEIEAWEFLLGWYIERTCNKCSFAIKADPEEFKDGIYAYCIEGGSSDELGYLSLKTERTRQDCNAHKASKEPLFNLDILRKD